MESIDSQRSQFLAQSNMAAGPTTYPSTTVANNTSSMMGLNNQPTPQMMPSGMRFQLNSMITPTSSGPFDSLNAGPFVDGSQSSMSFGIDSVKKKRGRPRKYTPDGNIALGLTPGSAVKSSGGGDGDVIEPVKKTRGRPPGSGKKQMNALGAGCIGFIPHVVMVQPGEDIASKILSVSQQGPRSIFILSACGSISHATLRQQTTSGSTVTYEGEYEIISLTGSLLLSDNNGTLNRTGGLSVSLAGPEGRVIGGVVAGMLIAASQVQIIVGSFTGDEKKNNSSGSGSGVPTQMTNFGRSGAGAVTSPPSIGASSDSSAENGDSSLNRHPGIMNNHNMQQMYNLWASQTPQ